MWKRVVTDDDAFSAAEEVSLYLEAAVENSPEKLISRIEFVWLRSRPIDAHGRHDVRLPAYEDKAQLAVAMKEDAGLVIELSVDAILSDDFASWISLDWASSFEGLAIRPEERLEAVLYAFLAHVAIRNGWAHTADTMIRKTDRVFFRAAVRHAIGGLEASYSELADQLAPDSVSSAPSSAQGRNPRTPITAEKVARVNFDELLRRLLGLEDPP